MLSLIAVLSLVLKVMYTKIVSKDCPHPRLHAEINQRAFFIRIFGLV